MSAVVGTTVQERVVDGARRAISDVGWQTATLERIAAEAGLSRMTLHRHGLGRDEIFALLGDAYESDFREALRVACARSGTASERLRHGLRAVCEVSERHLAFLRGLDDEADTRLFHERGASRPGYVSPIEQVIREGIDDASFRRVPVRSTATLLVNATDRTYRHLRTAHGWKPERARATIALLVDGLERA